MSQHKLQFEAPDTMNLCVLRLVDTSVYVGNGVAVTCPRLEVQVPGFTRAVEIPNPQPGFMYNLTACDLGLQTARCGTDFFDLPDGIYVLKYSVSPNEFVYVEYNHLRITKALNMIYEVLCDLDRGACEPPESVKKKMLELNYIEMVIKGAKADAEFCHNPKKSMQNYLYGLKLLNKLRGCTTGCSR